jgi:hypothetical protein
MERRIEGMIQGQTEGRCRQLAAIISLGKI